MPENSYQFYLIIMKKTTNFVRGKKNNNIKWIRKQWSIRLLVLWIAVLQWAAQRLSIWKWLKFIIHSGDLYVFLAAAACHGIRSIALSLLLLSSTLVSVTIVWKAARIWPSFHHLTNHVDWFCNCNLRCFSHCLLTEWIRFYCVQKKKYPWILAKE